MKNYWIYMMTNPNHTVIYTGVTDDLERRVHEHKDKKGSSFTSKYNVTMLVFYERFGRIYDALGKLEKIFFKNIGKPNRLAKTGLIIPNTEKTSNS